MKGRHFQIVTTCLIVLLVLVAGVLLRLHSSQSPHSEPHASAAEREIPESLTLSAESLQLADLGIETVRYQPLRRNLRLFGQIQTAPEATVHLNAPVTGRIVQLRVQLGSPVKAGQVLAVLDSRDIRQAQAEFIQAKRKMEFASAELRRRREMAVLGVFDTPLLEESRRELAQARAELRAAEAEHRTAQQAVHSEQIALRKARIAQQLAQARLERAQRLIDAQLISQQEYETLRAEGETATAEVQTAEARLDSARAALSSAEARLQSARESLQIAQAKFERSERMFRGQYLRSKEVAEAEANYQQSVLEYRAAEAALRLLRGKPGDGAYLQIVAPFDGTVVEMGATLGETVTPEKPLFRIVNTGKLWAVFDLYPEQVPLVRPGQRVRFKADALPGETCEAVIERVMPEADPNARVVKAIARIPRLATWLKPGQFIEGMLTVTTGEERMLLVPSVAVQTIEGNSYVFVVSTTPGVFHLRRVQVGEQIDNVAVIRDGLRPGERIVVRNAFLLKGMITGGGDH